MANNLDSNTTRKVARVFLKAFESNRVVTKTINTQLLQGQFNPQSGENVDFKRSHQYLTRRTPGGDISAGFNNDIIAGKATGTVQDYFTAKLDWTNKEEALELDQLEEIIAPAARQIVTDLEVDLARFMRENAALTQGTPGTGITAWSDVAESMALMDSIGVPRDSMWHYLMNPFGTTKLADAQGQLGAADNLVRSAWEMAKISKPFAGMQAVTSNSLGSYTSGDSVDRVGALDSTPDGTYVTHKDTMIQTLVLNAIDATGTVNPGDVLEFAGTGALARSRLNIANRQVIVDETGAPIPWRCTVVTGGTAIAGVVTVTVSSAALNETNGQYNNISVALASGDIFTILGAEDQVRSANLFYHRQAFGIGTVKLPKLFSTDTIATTEDGFSIRVSKYSDGDANTQSIRFDLLPAFAVFNPNFAGQGWG